MCGYRLAYKLLKNDVYKSLVEILEYVDKG